MSNNNMSGINGYGIKNYPGDDTLKASLLQYAKERLTVAQRLERLRAEHNLDIKKSRLAELNLKFNIPSVRKPPPPEIATQAVLEVVANDIEQRNGVGTIGVRIANEGVMILPRDFVRQVLATHAPEGLTRRFPGANRVRRSALVALGPNYQWHSDGHEKLGALGLRMGGVGLNIYGIKDQWSSNLLHLVVIPNDRLETTVLYGSPTATGGPVPVPGPYLRVTYGSKPNRTRTVGVCSRQFTVRLRVPVTGGRIPVHTATVRIPKKYGCIPITFVMDKGSETGMIFACQTGLREAYGTGITDLAKYPPAVHVQSIHNTPIEGAWHWFSESKGRTIKSILQGGFNDGIYNSNNPIHVQLFNWLWPRILQIQLDLFRQEWNNHRIRYQKEKPNMSGSTPNHGYKCPALPAEDCGLEVHQAAIDALRSKIPVPREEAMRWVTDTFDQSATAAYNAIGKPSLSTLSEGWAIFTQMAALLK
ncbi:hypothetical protein D9619_009977 [Psilocybe cf. subviscida]|uniref:Uncharacterized protein n=1 Tax=Psilocybe cf. subviscida TaxID=2480587 RepID=A0A8H5BLR0_9AGAR|nr:hypothetical protein D9619_009977 [Psilocybe cf. subviscida]